MEQQLLRVKNASPSCIDIAGAKTEWIDAQVRQAHAAKAHGKVYEKASAAHVAAFMWQTTCGLEGLKPLPFKRASSIKGLTTSWNDVFGGSYPYPYREERSRIKETRVTEEVCNRIILDFRRTGAHLLAGQRQHTQKDIFRKMWKAHTAVKAERGGSQEIE